MGTDFSVRDFRNFALDTPSASDQSIIVKNAQGQLATGSSLSATNAVSTTSFKEAIEREYGDSVARLAFNNVDVQANLTPQKIKTVLANLEKISREPIQDIFSLMSDFYAIAVSLRKLSQQAARAGTDAQVKAINDQVSHMKDSAKHAKDAGYWKAAFLAVSGLCQLGGAGMAGWKGNVEISTTAGKGLSGLSDAFGSYMETRDNYTSRIRDADATAQQANSTKASAHREEMIKLQDNAQENIRATLQAMQEILRSREQITQKIFA